MKTKTAPPSGATVGVISLGCAKNLVDSEHLIASLLRAGLTLTPDPEKADLLLINTCAFIHDAREEAIDAVLEACRRKEKGTCRGVIVTGCLPQRYRQQPECTGHLSVKQQEGSLVISSAASRSGTPREGGKGGRTEFARSWQDRGANVS